MLCGLFSVDGLMAQSLQRWSKPLTVTTEVYCEIEAATCEPLSHCSLCVVFMPQSPETQDKWEDSRKLAYAATI